MSLTGTLVRRARNAAPIQYVMPTGRGSALSFATPQTTGAQAQMAAMGGTGVLFSIVDKTSTAVASATWRLYRKARSGRVEDRVEVTDHLALRVLNNPNPFTTRQELLESTQQHIDLTGEGWWVVARDPRSTLPLELWLVRPDRMAPVPSAVDFLSGYLYTAPDGSKVPLDLADVVFIRRPNPLDPYRGLGPVQAVLTDIDSLRYSREWNRNFFLNSAEPGGIIEVERRLSDDEFSEMTLRWREQHQGVAQAHRVAVIEQGHWIDRKITQRDMQFSELNALSVEAIRMAFGFPKPMLGSVDDVNRANADAALVMMARHVTVPRLDRIKGALNADFLPLFGGAADGLEFDYDSPVPEDEEAENARWVAQSAAVAALVPLGFDAAETLAAFGLPEITFSKPEPPPPPVVAPTTQPIPGDPEAPEARARRRHPAGRLRNAQDVNPEDLPDISHAQVAWDAALTALLAKWALLVRDLKARLVDAVREVVASGSRVGLTQITLDAADAAAAIHQAMVDLAATSAGQVVTEAAAQGIQTAQGIADVNVLADIAHTAAILQTSDLESSAAREALRVWGPQSTPDAVADRVGAALDGLTDAGPRQTLGAALSDAQHEGRMASLRLAPAGSLYASETLDGATCAPCREVDGRWLGNTDDLSMVDLTYPTAGYIGCLGRSRCRGQVVGVWRPKQVAS